MQEIKAVATSEILDDGQKVDIIRDLIDDYDDAEGDGVPITIGT